MSYNRDSRFVSICAVNPQGIVVGIETGVLSVSIGLLCVNVVGNMSALLRLRTYHF